MIFFMKILFLCALATVSLADVIEIQVPQLDQPIFVNVEITEDQVKELYQLLESARDARAIVANVNEFVDKLFANTESFAQSIGLDPVILPEIDQGFLTAHITLTNGTLTGMGAVERDGDCTVSYSSDTRKLSLSLPIKFKNISFYYHYHIIILLVGPSGGVTGTMNDFRIDIGMSFDFAEYQAAVDSFDVTDSGHIDLTFDGHGVIDAIINIMSEFTTTILHPLIVGIMNGIIKGVLNGIVDIINSLIYALLHPPTTTEVVSTVVSNIMN